ncbi:hypothetical protein B0H11DRAFT_1927892 [Mycena galericulata]|nr:hypothetical protein B0H11DRAFT_1927892 [Mycena galericulata]
MCYLGTAGTEVIGNVGQSSDLGVTTVGVFGFTGAHKGPEVAAAMGKGARIGSYRYDRGWSFGSFGSQEPIKGLDPEVTAKIGVGVFGKAHQGPGSGTYRYDRGLQL